MKILALEPYYGGSHKAFIDGCAEHSQHDWTLIHAPPNKWKWRMHHCSVTFSQEINLRIEQGETWDLLFCSDMLDLPTFLGFCPALASLPSVVYFHENQLSYPLRSGEKRDLNYGFMNMKTALCAAQLWLNSNFHLKEFLVALDESLKLMPGNKLSGASEEIAGKSIIVPQGIESIHLKAREENSPPHILWAARWEYDKNPALFFDALSKLSSDFKLSVIGESFRNSPPVFAEAEERLKDKIVHWGYQESRQKYLSVLQEADIVVSTADHEFFGISVIEALHAGCFPVVPNALAYPEVLDIKKHPEYFYDGTAQALQQKLDGLLGQRDLFSQSARALRNEAAAEFTWDQLGPAIDKKLEQV